MAPTPETFKTITDYKGKTNDVKERSTSLLDELNTYYACLEDKSASLDIQSDQDPCPLENLGQRGVDSLRR